MVFFWQPYHDICYPYHAKKIARIVRGTACYERAFSVEWYTKRKPLSLVAAAFGFHDIAT